MTGLWIALPAAWELQDVQAALNVIVTVLSAFCIPTFARICWQTATAKVVKNRNVPLATLLSVDTIGEVYDVCRLLGLKILSSYYLRILAQCIVVTGLTAVAFASGPIARFSSRWGTKVVTRETPGLIANRLQSGISHEGVLWNNTWDSLDHAGFPYDRLLDYLPNITSNWKYVPTQWNSSWQMRCEYTEETPIDLTVVRVDCNDTSPLNEQIPALESVYPEITRLWGDNAATVYNYEGNMNSDNSRWSDVLMFRTGWEYLKQDDASGIWTDIDVTLMALRMQGVPGWEGNDTQCDFAPGPINAATYTKAFCKIRKNVTTEAGNFFVDIAYPDHESLDYVSSAYTSFFQGRYSREVIAGDPVTVITPRNLTRFYQVYQITQATQHQYVKARPMDVELDVVRLSTVFLALCIASALLAIFGIVHYGVFTLRHSKTVDSTPLSKLDWMLQSIEKSQAATPLIPHTSPHQNQQSRRSSRHSVVSMRSPDLAAPKVGRRRSDFETATYGSNPGPSQPYHMSWLSRSRSAEGGYFPLQEHPDENRLDSDISLLERHPTAPSGPLSHASGSGTFGSDYYVPR